MIASMTKFTAKTCIIITLLATFLLLFFHITSQQATVTNKPPVPSINIFRTDRIESCTYRHGVLTNKISADQIFVRSKKMGLFRIRNINEMVIKNLALEQIVHPEQEERDGDILIALQECLPGLKSSQSSSSPLGRIAAITIDGFSLKSSTSDGRILLACRAREGKINNKSTQLELSHIVLRSPDSGRVISAQKGQWNQNRQRFEIEGEYLAQSPLGRTKGHGISVDLHYQLGKL